jgi:pyruvate,water dikinase
MEWCLDQDNNLLILQCRSLVMQEDDPAQVDLPAINLLPLLLQGGETASRGLACGPICHLKSAAHLDDIPNNVILVCRHTPPSLAQLLPRLAGVVAEQGSMADHFASVARETGVPVLVKCNQACSRLHAGADATLWADNQTLYSGTLDLPPARPSQPRPSTPVEKAFTMAMKFISPLRLLNPASATFRATECRSFHDIIRFCHEKGVQAMFDQAASGLVRKGGTQQLRSAVPLALFVLDIGDGVVSPTKEIELIHITSVPLLALWKGLTHPAINWSKHDHFDWKAFDDIALAGGMARKNDVSFASFALVSSDYLNLNLRFGYHFVLLDALCGPTSKNNYIMLRFAGGGGKVQGKNLRLLFMCKRHSNPILKNHRSYVILSAIINLDRRRN